MPVLADFQPENASYGRSAGALIAGIDAGQSFAERRQAMRLRDAQDQRQQDEFLAKLPLIRAQATLTQVNAQSAVESAAERARFETRAAVEAPAFNKEFQDIMAGNSDYDVPASDGTPEGDKAQAEAAKFATQQTLNQRSTRLASLLSRVSYMKLLPEYKGFVDTVNMSANQTHMDAAGNAKLDELLAAANARAAASTYGADTRVKVAEVAAGAKAATASAYTASRERIEAIRADTKLTAIDKQGKIQAEKAGATITDLTNRAADADQLAAEASAEGNEETAAVHRQVASSYRDAVQKQSTFAGATPLVVPKKSPSVQPTPATTEAVSAEAAAANGEASPEIKFPSVAVAPTKVAPDAKTVDIGGKVYPVFKDKNGKRAYLVDGHYVPIDTD